MRIAIIGYGAVAAIHARQLTRQAEVKVVAVCGPDTMKAEAFALAHGITGVVSSTDQLGGMADAAIVCSPSACHFEQARDALQAGLSTLVEVPACGSSEEARELAAVAEHQGLHLHCAHTSRYIAPYRRLGELLGRGELGEIRRATGRTPECRGRRRSRSQPRSTS